MGDLKTKDDETFKLEKEKAHMEKLHEKKLKVQNMILKDLHKNHQDKLKEADEKHIDLYDQHQQAIKDHQQALNDKHADITKLENLLNDTNSEYLILKNKCENEKAQKQSYWEGVKRFQNKYLDLQDEHQKALEDHDK